ncbi:unnamed protein product [Owenia fusiformis]|uniref:Uncharacterized protein n=1 Tax=Owenia fusiformis TaxID=6347 RepID=A0A8S4NM66_OWEFU|nr:unnamed protein product [Owenia fusiformis]
MRDDNKHVLLTLLQNIKRLAMSLKLALMISFCHTLDNQDSFIADRQNLNSQQLSQQWGEQLSKFIQNSCASNASFQLYVDMIQHCEEVVALAVAERLGGIQGYDLLLAVVKSSLPFLSLNGAASYA